VYHFGETTESRDQPTDESYGTEARWFLTRIVDRFGNEIVFHYEKVLGGALNGRLTGIPIDIAIKSIEYTRNRNASLEAHVRIDFEYSKELDLCVGSGSFVPIGAPIRLPQRDSSL
jgi:hypothetical protein